MPSYEITLKFWYSSDKEDKDAALQEFKDAIPEWDGELIADKIEKTSN